MDPAAQGLDDETGEHRGAQKIQYQSGGAIPALADEELIGEDDEYEDLYNDVNVGEGIFQFHPTKATESSTAFRNNDLQAQTLSASEPRREADAPQGIGNSGVTVDTRYQNAGASLAEQKGEVWAVQRSEAGPVNHLGTPSMKSEGAATLSQNSAYNVGARVGNPGSEGLKTVTDIPNNQMVGSVNGSVIHPGGSNNLVRPAVEDGPTMVFVGELHWWTTDAELEDVLSHFGKVKEIKFFDERASGKSKGYCQVEFYDPAATAACKERMNGHVFNGRACVVAFASPQTLKQMGNAYADKNQSQTQPQPLGRRNMNDGVGRGGGMNYPAGNNGGNYGRGSWGRGGRGGFNRGTGFSGPRGRGGQMPAKNFGMNASGIGNGVGAGNYGQGLPGPAFGGPATGMMHAQPMMGTGFDPTFMGQGAGYGNFSGPAFPGMVPQFPAVNTMGFPGVAPHVNPAFFGRGMAPNGMGMGMGMGMMGTGGMDGHPGMWGDPSMGGWVGEEQGQRTRESSYGGDDGASDYGYSDANPEKGARPNATSREKERSVQRYGTGNSERRQHDEIEKDLDKSDRSRRYREDKDDLDGGVSSSRSRSRSQAMPEGDGSRLRDVDYGKRRRVPE